MRNRSNSGVRLDVYQRMVQRTILKYQNHVTGLLPATPNHPHAWVRDNVYSILAVWGLALSYKKTADLDEDRAKAYELEMSVVKLMRGLLRSMMTQIPKVEKFKSTQSPLDCLHAKYSVSTGQTVVGDKEWGHLQLDATSLYLLVLAEMTASGLQIVYSLDEVAFIQNLVFYIQAAYRTPDYGIWERGDKTNHGFPELNATSIGMTKAALEALNELDLFGAKGGPSSVIHVIPDEAQQCRAILHSVLPRESNSKETDAGLLTVISYPAFAVDDPEIIENTREALLQKLEGRYGMKRFLRDGYKTPKEDPHRLHYETWELAEFEDIECEWPVFFAYMVLDGLFTKKDDQICKYSDLLEEVMIKREDGCWVMPELYAVPGDKVGEEKAKPKSVDRIHGGKVPQMWGQSMYVLGRLLKEGHLSPGELDPLNRRLSAEAKPDTVVQVVIVAEDESIQEKLAYYDLKVQNMKEITDFKIYPARVLSHLFSHLGKSKKLGLTGRPSDVVGILATSKLYTLGDTTMCFFPQFVDYRHFYLPLDVTLMIDMVKVDIQYLGQHWQSLGRPTLIFPIRRNLLDVSQSLHPALVATIKKLQSGYINGTRVHLGTLADFVTTSCVTNLTFLTEAEDSPGLTSLINNIKSIAHRHESQNYLSGGGPMGAPRSRTSSTAGSLSKLRRKSSVKGIIRRSCSIQVDEMPDLNSYSGRYDRRRSSDDSYATSPFPNTDSSSGDLAGSSTVSGSGSPTTTDLPAGPLSPGVSGSGAPNVPFSPLGEQHPHLKGENLPEHYVHGYHDKSYAGVDVNDLVEQLKDTDALHEQADIIHYLFLSKGADWDTKMDGKEGVKVRDLLSELYDKAGHLKQWWLVRHTAGMLHKRVEDLAKAATDIIVRQKQLAVGLPPEPREKIITRPLPPDELATIIHEACGDDHSTAMLTQEILVYLAMFIRTEPRLFSEMLRLRVGLIIQVMASELSRTLKCSGEEASDQLLNLSPFEMKTLLHHILSGKEFGCNMGGTPHSSARFSIVSLDTRSRHRSGNLDLGPQLRNRTASAGAATFRARQEGSGSIQQPRNRTVDELPRDGTAPSHLQDSLDMDRHGQWLRRRRLDAALNRVPLGFYPDTWKVLGRCHGLKIGNHTLPTALTKEMTANEMKFALQVEMVLNQIPKPEFRQLIVEAMMVLILIVENDAGKCRWNDTIHVDRIVYLANDIFIEEQSSLDGDVTLCCAGPNPRPNPLTCSGAAGICQNFYDTAPSGRYGTMSYLCKATTQVLNFNTHDNGNLDCAVS